MVKLAGLEAGNEYAPNVAPSVTSWVELNQLVRLAVVDMPVKQHPHRSGRFAINGKLHAAVAQQSAVRQRVAELHLRLGRFAGSFWHDNKGVFGNKTSSSRKHGAHALGWKRMGRLEQARWISRSVGPIARPGRRSGSRLQVSFISTRRKCTLQCVAILPQSFAGQNPCFSGSDPIHSYDTCQRARRPTVRTSWPVKSLIPMSKATYKESGVDLDVYAESMSRLPRL